MKVDNIKLSIQPTKNPLFYNLSVPVTDEEAKNKGLSHAGRAYCLLSKDEVKALCAMGFKPFSTATLDIALREVENSNPDGNTLIKFDLAGTPKFQGGFGTWDEVLKAPAPATRTAESF